MQQLKNITSRFQTKLLASDKLEVDGLIGYQFIAEVQNGERQCLVYAATLFWREHYVQVIGIAAKDQEQERALAVYGRLTRSFRRSRESLDP